MKIVQWVFGLLFGAIVVGGMVLVGIGLRFYVDLPSILIVVVGGLLLSSMSHGLAGVGRAYRSAVSAHENSGSAERRQAIEVLAGLKTNLFYAAFVGMVIGTVAILSNSGHTDEVAQGVATMILTLLYALVVNLLFVMPFLHRVRAMVAATEG